MKALLIFATVCVSTAYAADARIDALLARFHEPSEVASASKQLKSLVSSSPDLKRELTTDLMSRLSDTTDPAAWRAEAALVGDLQLADLAPILAASLDTDMRGGGSNHDILTNHIRMSLDYDPAAKALVALGPLSVTATQKELNAGNRIGRIRAVNVLTNIGGPDVEATLRQRYAIETDPRVRNMIAAHLNISTTPQQ